MISRIEFNSSYKSSMSPSANESGTESSAKLTSGKEINKSKVNNKISDLKTTGLNDFFSWKYR